MTASVNVRVDGNLAALIDLSTMGAQIVSATILKPSQRVRMSLPDDQGMIRCDATIAWASCEMPPASGTQYRAGVAFTDVDAHAAAIEAFCGRYGQGLHAAS